MSSKIKSKIERVFIDNNFLIDFVSISRPRHEEAKKYLHHFMENGSAIYLSTVVLAEYGIKGSVTDLPLRNFRIVSFTARHANQCSTFEKELFEQRSSKQLDVDRQVIHNDTKILAQAVEEKATVLLSADNDMKKLFDQLSKRFPLKTRHINHGETPLNAYTGSFLSDLSELERDIG